jgi:nucleoside-diphosphate-sugar epimerase
MGGIGYISHVHAEVCKNNTLMNMYMLESSVSNGVKRFLFSSTACIYPLHMQTNEEILPLKESDAHPAAPEEGYGWEKLYMEKLCEYYMKDKGLETRVVRFHNVYGPCGSYKGGREKAPAAVCFKVANAEDHSSIEIWGDGKQTRSFMYVDDCVEGVLRLMESDFSNPLNLGRDDLITIDSLYDLAFKISGKSLSKNYDLTKPQGVRGRNSDNTLIRSVLSWEPSISIEVGMAKTYNWISDRVKMDMSGEILGNIVGAAVQNVKDAESFVGEVGSPVDNYTELARTQIGEQLAK